MKPTSRYYVSLKKKDALSIKPLLLCLGDLKSWLVFDYLNFNKKKSEVMCVLPPIDFGPLAQHVKPTITHLGFEMDNDFKLVPNWGSREDYLIRLFSPKAIGQGKTLKL